MSSVAIAGMKPFEPFEPGARMTWRHYYPQAGVVVRSGTVWERAPSVDDAVVVAWVIPDESLPGDLYAAIPVGKSTRRSNSVHGMYLDGASPQHAARSEAYSSNYAGSPLGQLAMVAARAAWRHREVGSR